jgi:hypothetical protein
MRRLLASLTLLATLCLGARAARADDPDAEAGETWVAVLIAITTLGPIDVGLAIHDVAVTDSSRTYGKVETIVMAPQVVGTTILMVDTLAGDGPTDEKVGSVILFAATSALLAHGVHEWIEDDRPRDEPRVAPMMVGDGTAPGLGFGLSGAW